MALKVVNKFVPRNRKLKERIVSLLGMSTISISIALLATWLIRPGAILEESDLRLSDWLTTLMVDKVSLQRDDIVLITVDDRTLTHYEYTQPTSRTLLASLINAAAQAEASVIGLDVAVLRQTETRADGLLEKTIRAANVPVVVAAVDERSGLDSASARYQRRFLEKSGATPGHAYFQRTEYAFDLGDDVVRNSASHSASSEFPVSFAEQLASVRRPVSLIGGDPIAWQTRDNAAASALFRSFTVQPHTPPGDEGQLLEADTLIPKALMAFVKDRIVIIGGDYRGVDQHLTPLSLTDSGLFPGHFIHAQLVAQLLDERTLASLSGLATLLLLTLLAIVGLHVGQSGTSRWVDLCVGLTAILMTLYVGAKHGYILPSEMMLAWTLSLSVAKASKLAIITMLRKGAKV